MFSCGGPPWPLRLCRILHVTFQICFLGPRVSHRRAGPYKIQTPGGAQIRVPVPWVRRFFGDTHVHCDFQLGGLGYVVSQSRCTFDFRPHPLALISGPPPARTWFALVCRGLRSAQPPRGLEPAGGSPWVLRLGRQLWSLLRLGPVAARGLCPTCAVCRLPAETLPFSPSLGADRFLGRYPLVTIVF